MTPETITTIEQAIHAWIVACSGLDAQHVIFSHQNAPSPEGPYITITAFEEADTYGHTPEQFMDEDGNPYELAHWRIEGSIDAWRTGAMGLLTRTKARMFLPSYYQPLQDAGLAVHLPAPIRYIPGLVVEQWEDHAQLDLIIHFGDVITTDTGEGSEPVGWFDKVQFSIDEPDRPIPPTTVTGD